MSTSVVFDAALPIGEFQKISWNFTEENKTNYVHVYAKAYQKEIDRVESFVSRRSGGSEYTWLSCGLNGHTTELDLSGTIEVRHCMGQNGYYRAWLKVYADIGELRVTASTVTWAWISDNLRITMTNDKQSQVTHHINIYIDNVLKDSVDVGANQSTYTIQRSSIDSWCASKTSATIKVTVQTYSGGSAVGNYVTKTTTVSYPEASYKPTITFGSGTTDGLTLVYGTYIDEGDVQKLFQNVTSFRAQATISAKGGATVRWSFWLGDGYGTSGTSTSIDQTFQCSTIGDKQFVIEVTDSRGYTARATGRTYNLRSYFVPQIWLAAIDRSEEGAVALIKYMYCTDVDYADGTPGFAVEIQSGNGAWVALPQATEENPNGWEKKIDTNGDTYMSIATSLPPDNALDVAVRLKDRLNSTGLVTYHIGTMSAFMRFDRAKNVVAFGGYPQDIRNGVSVPEEWDIYKGDKRFLEYAYPVGSLYFNEGVDPYNLFGFGTWNYVTVTLNGVTAYMWKRTA